MSLRSWRVIFLVSGVLSAANGSTVLAQELTIDDAKSEVAALEEQFGVAQKAMRAKMSALRESEQYKKLLEKGRETGDFSELSAMTRAISDPFDAEWRNRIQREGAAYAFACHEGEIGFAALLIRSRLVDDPGALVNRIINSHSGSEHLLPIVMCIRYAFALPMDEVNALVDRIVADGASSEIKAQAHFARASKLGRSNAEEDIALAKSDREAVLSLVPADSLLGLRARGPEFQETRLQIGMEVPDIIGTDIQGVDFKLSDYRGKVVMLDFWGNW